MKSICIWLAAILLLTACGTGAASGSTPTPTETPVPSTPTAVPTATPTPKPVPTPRPTTIPVAVATAVPLLDSITLVRVRQGWSVISTMLADPGLQGAGDVSEDRPYSQDIPFKIEGITLVAHIELSVDNTSDGDITGVLYSRSDRTQWIIPIVVTHSKSEGAPSFRVDTVAQHPGNTLLRSAIPANLKMTVYR
ncbi:MAG: hypothetical protein RI947_311 [Candidatus Parcubacteria bacterium]